MTALISWLIGDGLQIVAPMIAGLIAVVVAWFGGRKSANAKRDLQDARANDKAHERINNADTGIGATDDQRIERLRDFAAKHGNRPAEKRGR